VYLFRLVYVSDCMTVGAVDEDYILEHLVLHCLKLI